MPISTAIPAPARMIKSRLCRASEATASSWGVGGLQAPKAFCGKAKAQTVMITINANL
ncbi:MAG TPA: hypothetical protein VGY77_06675 [Gemmataceae bacterium]|nr:hypothetical protein [Gemmataceae bacterium]